MSGDGNAGDEDAEKLQELKERHEDELRRLRAELEAARSKSIAEIEELKEKNSDYAEKAQHGSNEHITEINILKEKLGQATMTITSLNEQIQNLDFQKLELLKDAEERYTDRIKDFEKQLEAQQSTQNTEIQEMQAKSEEALAQLKNFYEVERDRLERRLLEEKGKYETRYNK